MKNKTNIIVGGVLASGAILGGVLLAKLRYKVWQNNIRQAREVQIEFERGRVVGRVEARSKNVCLSENGPTIEDFECICNKLGGSTYWRLNIYGEGKVYGCTISE